MSEAVAAVDGTVRIDREGEVAVFTLDRARRHNALVPGFLDAFLRALSSDAARKARGWLVCAAGPSFSTGGDLAGFHAAGDAVEAYAEGLVGALNETLLALYRFEGSVACAVGGRVTGGSLGWLLAADHVVMRRGVTVRPWYPAVGFAPDGGWEALLPARIGAEEARAWLEADEEREADECLRLGLADAVTDGAPEHEALCWLTEALEGRVVAKRHDRPSPEALAEALERERRAFVRQVNTRQAREGVARYLERRR